MTTVISDQWRHAQKHHHCNICANPILPGDLHRVAVSVDDGEFWTWRFCPRCIDVGNAFIRSGDLAVWLANEGWTSDAITDWAEDIALHVPDHPAYRLAARLSTETRYYSDARRADLLAQSTATRKKTVHIRHKT